MLSIQDINTQRLIQVVENNIASGKKNTEEIEEYYFVDRYLLEKKYSNILTSIKNIRPSEILISSGNLSEILDHNAIASLQSSLDNTKVSIICDASEYRINQLKNNVINHKQKKRNRIQWVERENINQTNIVLYPQCAINIKYLPIPVGKDYLIQEVAEITFEKEKIQKQKDGYYDYVK